MLMIIIIIIIMIIMIIMVVVVRENFKFALVISQIANILVIFSKLQIYSLLRQIYGFKRSPFSFPITPNSMKYSSEAH